MNLGFRKAVIGRDKQGLQNQWPLKRRDLYTKAKHPVNLQEGENR
jgi:hypothetical protein